MNNNNFYIKYQPNSCIYGIYCNDILIKTSKTSDEASYQLETILDNIGFGQWGIPEFMKVG